MFRPRFTDSTHDSDMRAPFYRHVTARAFRPQDWVSDEGWRVVLHDAQCPRPVGDGACECALVDIKTLKKRRTS